MTAVGGLLDVGLFIALDRVYTAADDKQNSVLNHRLRLVTQSTIRFFLSVCRPSSGSRVTGRDVVRMGGGWGRHPQKLELLSQKVQFISPRTKYESCASGTTILLLHAWFWWCYWSSNLHIRIEALTRHNTSTFVGMLIERVVRCMRLKIIWHQCLQSWATGCLSEHCTREWQTCHVIDDIIVNRAVHFNVITNDAKSLSVDWTTQLYE